MSYNVSVADPFFLSFQTRLQNWRIIHICWPSNTGVGYNRLSLVSAGLLVGIPIQWPHFTLTDFAIQRLTDWKLLTTFFTPLLFHPKCESVLLAGTLRVLISVTLHDNFWCTANGRTDRRSRCCHTITSGIPRVVYKVNNLAVARVGRPYRLYHSCSVRTVRTLRLGKSSGTLWNFITDMKLYGTILIFHFAGQSVLVVDSSACSTHHVPAIAP